jgi:RNA polymerase sigma factor (sigma-70 family)
MSPRADLAGSIATAQMSGEPLEELYRAHADWLRETLRRRYGEQWADDLTQETFFRAAVYVEADIATPRALLATIAKNVARDQFRRVQVRANHATLLAGEDSFNREAPSAIDDDFHVREVIKSLPPKFREVILLSKIGGLTNREIAQRYKVSIRTIDKRLKKAVALVVVRLRD